MRFCRSNLRGWVVTEILEVYIRPNKYQFSDFQVLRMEVSVFFRQIKLNNLRIFQRTTSFIGCKPSWNCGTGIVNHDGRHSGVTAFFKAWNRYEKFKKILFPGSFEISIVSKPDGWMRKREEPRRLYGNTQEAGKSSANRGRVRLSSWVTPRWRYGWLLSLITLWFYSTLRSSLFSLKFRGALALNNRKRIWLCLRFIRRPGGRMALSIKAEKLRR